MKTDEKILLILYSKGQVTIAELSSELGCDRSTMSKQMKSLVENGDIYVVERERVKYFYLTEKGIEKAMILQPIVLPLMKSYPLGK